MRKVAERLSQVLGPLVKWAKALSEKFTFGSTGQRCRNCLYFCVAGNAAISAPVSWTSARRANRAVAALRKHRPAWRVGSLRSLSCQEHKREFRFAPWMLCLFGVALDGVYLPTFGGLCARSVPCIGQTKTPLSR
jgi:hypothetical protein